MHVFRKYRILRILFIMTIAAASAACSIVDLDFTHVVEQGKTEDEEFSRDTNISERRVLIYMAMGFNNLMSYITEDIQELSSNYLPGDEWNSDIMLIFSHLPSKYGDYSTSTSPTLTRLYKDFEGNIHKDTLMVMDKSTISASAETVREVLEFTRKKFPASGYGMVFSSHGTGWVPEDYCNQPDKYDNSRDRSIWMAPQMTPVVPKPYLYELTDNGGPAVKSIGVQNVSKSVLIEIDLNELVDAIPMKMDYIIFDACFMGGVEVAYEFRGKCDKLIFSQTEILADGMDYKTMASYLIGSKDPDLTGFCENYFQYYNSQSGDYRSATISMVDCQALDPLVQACKDIFDKNRNGIAALDNSPDIQRYFRTSYSKYHKWFFDLYDIAEKCGASSGQLDSLKDALGKCILYKAATEVVIDIPIRTHSGLSMYLPYKNRTYLNDFYKTLEWNKVTGLVQ